MQLTEQDLPAMTAAISDSIVRCVETGEVFAAAQPDGFATSKDTGAALDVAAVADGAAAELGLQTWRLQRRVQSLDAEKNPKECRQLLDSCRRFEKLLESLGLEVVDPVGREYVDGWSEVEVVSWEPQAAGEQTTKAVIKQTICPIIRRSGKIIKVGQVIVAEPNS